MNGGGAGGYPGWFIDDICIQAAVSRVNPPNIVLLVAIRQGTIYNLAPTMFGRILLMLQEL